MPHVIACIDGSASAPAVCDYAAWASLSLGAPLTFLHVLDQRQYPVAADLSGNIGLGSREHLLDELTSLDEQRGKLALEQGRIMLAAAKERAIADGVTAPEGRQRHGDLLESLRELESETRLLVIGRQGKSSGGAEQHVGSQLESVIRLMQRPVLVTPVNFKRPGRAMLAFDGSATTRKGVEMLASSPLLKGMPVHLVMVGAQSKESWAQLDAACDALGTVGIQVYTAIRTGEVEPTLHAYQAEHGIDLLVMGAYGHSRIRQFLIGSTTTTMLRTTDTPLLLLR
ncbi:universal stress protein [Pseudomonas aeruginosa]|uniref:universal stress protein n=1 Tax=Pseudomonas aeruginosa TaxID=287 RepID=UPI001C95D3C0|nr:universal stress protein [Pseudomonas aeruginosa]WAJ81456.1 universal stress protein [Pseudomonas aeruginosa]HBO1414522.1 universal stress protein [Pseudomonas aeruginosa]HBO3807473.1 universal stress protein [Pseudomonas aeruginosa]HBO7425057.1 universal stress protein [Pseudomonas aeruginosa]HCL3530015.1 universal stress protein [Pseudomonas aeruginosa]